MYVVRHSVTAEDKVFIDTIPLPPIDESDPRTGFYQSGQLLFNKEKLAITKRENPLFMYYMNFTMPEYPSTFGPHSTTRTISDFRFALRFLDQDRIDRTMKELYKIKNHAQDFISRPITYCSMLIHGSFGVPLHNHINVAYGNRVSAYGVRLNTATESTVRFKVKDVDELVFTKSNLTRLVFNPYLEHEVSVDSNDKGMYLWMVFDDVVEFTDPEVDMSTDAVNIWDIGITGA